MKLTRIRIALAALATAGLTAWVGVPALHAAPTCTISYVGPDGGSWHAGANWSAGTVPASGDHVCLTGTGTVVHSSGSTSVQSIQGPMTLRLTAGDLYVTDTTGDAALERLEQSGGTLAGDGTLTVGTLDWSGGWMSWGGLTRVTGTTSIHGDVFMNVGRRLDTVDGAWTSGTIEGRNRAVLTVRGTFDMRPDGGNGSFYNWDGTARPTVHVVGGGTVTKTAGPARVALDWALDNDGTVRSQAGLLAWTGGGGQSTGLFAGAGGSRTVLDGGTFTIGNATFEAVEVGGGAIVDVADGATFTGADLWQSGGTIQGLGTFESTGTFVWTAGWMGGTGLTRSTGTTTIAGDVFLNLGRRLETRDGAWTSGTIQGRNRAVWTITGGFDMKPASGSNATFYNWDGTARPAIVVADTGTITRTAGEHTTSIDLALDVDGATNPGIGRLRFTGGGAGTQSTGHFGATGTGRTVLAGGIFDIGNASFGGVEVSEGGIARVADGATWSGTDLWQSGGTIDGGGTVDSSGSFDWSGGWMGGTGLTRSTGTTHIHGDVFLNLARRLETADGAWTSGTIQGRNRSVWTVTGTFDMRPPSGSNATFYNWDGTTRPALVVAPTGTLTRTSGDHDTSIDLALENDGTITAAAGRLRFTGGGAGESTGAFNGSATGRTALAGGIFGIGTASFAGVEVTEGGIARVADGATWSGTDLRQTGGTIDGAGTVVSSGTLDWSGGWMGGSGLTRSTGTTHIRGDVFLNLERRLETKDGAWTAGTIQARNRSVWTVTGTFDMRPPSGSNATFYNWDSTARPVIAVAPTGTLTRSAGAHDTSVDLELENDGTITAAAGRLRFTGGGTGESTGAFNGTGTGRTALAGGTFPIGTATFAGVQVTEGGIARVADGATWSGTDLLQTGGTVDGPGTVTASGTYDWRSGWMGGSGLTDITGTLSVNAADVVHLNVGRRLRTVDTTWTAGGIEMRNRAEWTSTGTFDASSDARSIVSYNWDGSGQPAIVMQGALTRTAATGYTAVNVPLRMDGGSVDQGTGELRLQSVGGSATGRLVAALNGGTVTLAGSDVVLGGRVAGANVVLADGARASAAQLELTGGSIGGAGELVVGERLSWKGGRLQGTGSTVIGRDATLALEPASTWTAMYVEGGHHLLTGGSTTWTRGHVAIRKRGTWVNSGKLTAATQSGHVIDAYAVYADASERGEFVNTGTIETTGTGGELRGLVNDGTVRVLDGGLDLSDLRQTADGRLVSVLSGASGSTVAGRLVSDTVEARLAGTLAVEVADGHVPQPGSYAVFSRSYSYGALGAFERYEAPALPEGQAMEFDVAPMTITAKVTGTASVTGTSTVSSRSLTTTAADEPATDDGAAAPATGGGSGPATEPVLVAADDDLTLVDGRTWLRVLDNDTAPAGSRLKVVRAPHRVRLRYDRRHRVLRLIRRHTRRAATRRGAKRRMVLRYRLVSPDGERSRVAKVRVRFVRAR